MRIDWVQSVHRTNKKVQVRCFISTLIKNIMLTPSKTVTRLLLRSNHGLFFDQQLNDPMHLFLQTTQQQQMRQMSQQGLHVQAKKSLFDFHPTGVMDRDVAKVCIFLWWDPIENRKGILTGGCSFEEGNSSRQSQRFWSRGRAPSTTVCRSHEKVVTRHSWRTCQQWLDLRWIDGYFKKLARHPTYVEAVDGCNHEELTVPVKEGEGGQVPIDSDFAFL